MQMVFLVFLIRWCREVMLVINNLRLIQLILIPLRIRQLLLTELRLWFFTLLHISPFRLFDNCFLVISTVLTLLTLSVFSSFLSPILLLFLWFYSNSILTWSISNIIVNLPSLLLTNLLLLFNLIDWFIRWSPVIGQFYQQTGWESRMREDKRNAANRCCQMKVL